MNTPYSDSPISSLTQTRAAKGTWVSRRAFGVIAVFTAVLLTTTSCDDGSITDTLDTGTVRVVVTGVSAAAANAGTVRYEGTLGVINVTVPTSGVVEQAIPIGTYQITYTPPAGHTLATGQTPDRTVVVTVGALTEVTFALATPPGTTGTIRVTVSGLATGASSGGSASILRTDIGGQTAATLNIPAAGSADLPVPAGTYQITYSAPSGYQLATGQVNPRNATITAGAGVTAAFTVTATQQTGNGTMRLSVSGLASGATAGGSVSILRTDISGQTPTTTNVSATATDVPLPVGTYSVTYTLPSGYQLASGQANPRTGVTITASQTTSVGFAVSQTTPGTPSIIFFSDFRTATGNSINAVTDGGKWNINAVTPETMQIISSQGLDFPTPNVMQMTATSERQGFAIVRKTGMPVPQVGESRFYRWYIRMTQIDGLIDYQTHPIQDGNNASTTNWMFIVYNGGGGSGIPNGMWQPQFWADNDPVYNNMRWYAPILSKNVTYRFEMQILRNTTNTFQMHIRIYDASGNLIATDADIHNISNAARLSSNPSLGIGDPSWFDGLNAGNNGIGSLPANSNFTYAYQAGFCVRSDDWCGPYNGNF
jgi:hypothetical protein